LALPLPPAVIIVSTPPSTSRCAPIHNSACLAKAAPTGIEFDLASLILASWNALCRLSPPATTYALEELFF
jgi:hypothetical protein